MSFGPREDFSYVVIRQAGTKSQVGRLRSIGHCDRRPRLQGIESETESLVDDDLERFAHRDGICLCPLGNIRIKRQSGSHDVIMMLTLEMSSHSGTALTRKRRLRGGKRCQPPKIGELEIRELASCPDLVAGTISIRQPERLPAAADAAASSASRRRPIPPVP